MTLTEALTNVRIKVDTRMANALLFFFDGQYLDEFDDHQHVQGNLECVVALDLSHFKPNQDYLLEIFSVSLGLDNGAGAGAGYYEEKGVVENVWFDAKLLKNDEQDTYFWEHQKGLIGEYLQIYTEQGSSKVQ